MAEKMIKTVAIVGAGVIGRGWIQVFARAGCYIRIYDRDPHQIQKALDWFEEDLRLDVAGGFTTTQRAEARKALVSTHLDLEEALAGAEYIQESGPERLEIKKAIFAEVDHIADKSAIIASSTSTLDINNIAADLSGINRCVMAHPFNPPNIVPVVEVMPTKETDPEIMIHTIEFLKKVGQKPVVVNFFISGYLINRIQAAVVREAIHLVEKGVAGVDAVDTVMRDGLGLRWALLGSFGVNNTNADGGIREYYTKYGNAYAAIMNDLDSTSPSFNRELIERIGREVDAMECGASVEELCRWRDRMVRSIRAIKEEDPHPCGKVKSYTDSYHS